MPDNPFVFVVGCPRSGTTLLQRMLDAHPALAVANDTHFVPRCLEKHVPHLVDGAIDGARIALTGELVDGVLDYHRFHRLGLGPEAARRAADGATDYAHFVSLLYDRFAAARGKPLGGEKTPDYVRRLPLLGGLFPTARFVHIVRDGRDVALSVMDWADERKGPGKIDLWADSPIATSALWWAWQVEHGRRDGAALGERFHELRYERLVADPEQQLRDLTAFLDLPFADEMLRFHEGRARSTPGKSAKSNWLPPTRGLRDWRRQLGPRDVELFEALVGPLLEELGLERVSAPSAEIERTAAAFRERWTQRLRRRREKRERRVSRALARAAAR